MTDLHAVADRAVLEEERDFLLRSLRDLEAERSAGDIDEVDYRALRTDYTARAAMVLRRLEALDTPAAGPDPAARSETPPEDLGSGDGSGPATGGPRRPRWRSRRLGVAVVVGALVAAGLGWAVVAATGRRLPGGVATGQAVGQEEVATLLLQAEAATAKGDGVTALKDLEAVLKQDPNQYVALSDEGWILAQTQQPQLLLQGIGLLSRAVRVEPDYPPARLYRGVAYLSEDDYVPAVNDLRWYLANGPDPQLVARVRQALTQAEAGVARTAKAATPPKSPPAGTAAG